MSAWREMERVALLGTWRESMQLPEIAPALDTLLSGLNSEELEHSLLSAAGALSVLPFAVVPPETPFFTIPRVNLASYPYLSQRFF